MYNRKHIVSSSCLPACDQGPDRCVDGPPEDLELLQGCCSLDFVVGLLTRHLRDWSDQLVFWPVGVLGSIFAFLHCHLICCPVEFLLLISLERPLIHFPRLSVLLCCSLSPILHFTLVLCLHCTDSKCWDFVYIWRAAASLGPKHTAPNLGGQHKCYWRILWKHAGIFQMRAFKMSCSFLSPLLRLC